MNTELKLISTEPEPIMLRPYQKLAVAALLQDVEEYKSIGLIAPTGAGKTLIMREFAESYLDKHSIKPNIIIVSHLDILQGQTFASFSRHCKYRCARLGGGKPVDSLARVIITTMQTLRMTKRKEEMDRRLLSNQTAVIIIDEAQLYGAQSYTTIEQMYPSAKVIGMSASPYRKAKYSFSQFEKVSYSISLGELIDQGYLVNPVLHEIDLAGMSVAERMAHVVAIYAQTEEPNGSIVYWNTKENAGESAACFQKEGIRAAAITDDTPKKSREDILEKFDKGEIKVLCNVNVLSAGYDSPMVYSIFLPMGTKSPVQYIQKVGRGLRKDGSNKKVCNVYIYGPAPSISRGDYRKLHKVSLKVKDDPEYGKDGDVYEILDWLEVQEDIDHIKVKWTKEIIRACEQVKKLGYDSLADLIRKKKFPKRYLKTIGFMGTSISASAEMGQITDSQGRYLVAKGFETKDLVGLENREASTLIKMIQSSLNRKWFARAGLHENKHISEIPMAYIGALVKKKQFNHPALRLYNEWKNAGKPT